MILNNYQRMINTSEAAVDSSLSDMTKRKYFLNSGNLESKYRLEFFIYYV